MHHKAEPQDWPEWDDWLARLRTPIRVGSKGSVFDSYPVVVQAAVEGHGIALGWRRTMEKLLHSGALMRPFAESVALADALSVYQRPGRTRPETKALLNWLKRELAA